MARAKRSKAVRKAPVKSRSFGQIKSTALGAVNTLISQGAALQEASRNLALAKAREARASVAARADEARSRTVDAMSHLERVFERRVSKAMSRLGVPSSADVRALSRQVAQLQASVDQLRRARARA